MDKIKFGVCPKTHRVQRLGSCAKHKDLVVSFRLNPNNARSDLRNWLVCTRLLSQKGFRLQEINETSLFYLGTSEQEALSFLKSDWNLNRGGLLVK